MSEAQIEKLELDIQRVNKCLTSRYRGPPREEPTVKEFYATTEPEIQKWFMENPILPIPDTKKLDMNDALGQAS